MIIIILFRGNHGDPLASLYDEYHITVRRFP